MSASAMLLSSAAAAGCAAPLASRRRVGGARIPSAAGARRVAERTGAGVVRAAKGDVLLEVGLPGPVIK